jgi:hypothetical protein
VKSWVGKKPRMTKRVQLAVKVGPFMKTHEWFYEKLFFALCFKFSWATFCKFII